MACSLCTTCWITTDAVVCYSFTLSTKKLAFNIQSSKLPRLKKHHRQDEAHEYANAEPCNGFSGGHGGVTQINGLQQRGGAEEEEEEGKINAQEQLPPDEKQTNPVGHEAAQAGADAAAQATEDDEELLHVQSVEQRVQSSDASHVPSPQDESEEDEEEVEGMPQFNVTRSQNPPQQSPSKAHASPSGAQEDEEDELGTVTHAPIKAMQVSVGVQQENVSTPLQIVVPEGQLGAEEDEVVHSGPILVPVHGGQQAPSVPGA